MRAFWDIAPCSLARGLFITLMMDAVSSSETSVYCNKITRRYIPEGSRLHTRRPWKTWNHIFIKLFFKEYTKQLLMLCFVKHT
jgi:hypothetical protein